MKLFYWILHDVFHIIILKNIPGYLRICPGAFQIGGPDPGILQVVGKEIYGGMT